MTMKTKVESHFPHHTVSDFNSDIYIADYTEQTKNDTTKKGLEISITKPTDIRSFLIRNGKSILFHAVLFDKNSFVNVTTGSSLTHCESTCFSSAEYDRGPWILFLELKYCQPHSKHQKVNIEKAKSQLVDTYKHYKDQGIINNKQQCYLVVSFPFFSIPFPNFLTTQAEVKKMKFKRVIFRGVNELKIKNEYKLEV